MSLKCLRGIVYNLIVLIVIIIICEGRILSYMKDVEAKKAHLESGHSGEFENLTIPGSEESRVNGGHISHFLPTSRRIVQFSNGKVY